MCSEIRSRLDANGLTQALFNAPPGNWEKGERGLASLPGREEEFQASIRRALEYAAVLGNERLHVMAGLLEPGLFRCAHRAVYMKNMSWAAAQADAQGDHDSHRTDQWPRHARVFRPSSGRGTRDLQGNRSARICAFNSIFTTRKSSRAISASSSVSRCAGIGHIQVAGVPDRHEPDEGELNYPYLLRLLDELGYWRLGRLRIPASCRNQRRPWLAAALVMNRRLQPMKFSL